MLVLVPEIITGAARAIRKFAFYNGFSNGNTGSISVHQVQVCIEW